MQARAMTRPRQTDLLNVAACPRVSTCSPVGFRTRRSGARVVLCGMVLGLIAGQWSPVVHAAGDEFSQRGDDLVLTASTRWAGCGNGGYYPVRMLLQNAGDDCTVTVTFTGHQEGIPSAQRTIAIAQNATVKFTLPIPAVGTGTYGELRVYRNGRLVTGLSESFSIPDLQTGGTPRPAFLVISPTNVDFDGFETAVLSTLPEAMSGAIGATFGGYYYGVAPEDHERIEPSLLPDEWIAYSGLDLVGVPLATLESLSASEQSALLKWVHTGGTLIVYEIGDDPSRSTSLNALLETSRSAALGMAWQPADVSRRQPLKIVPTDEYGNVLYETELEEMVVPLGGAVGGPSPDEAAHEEPPVVEPPAEYQWPADAETFSHRPLMLGQVYAFRGHPFPGTPHDWHWFVQSLPDDARSWTVRQGISSRVGSDEFFNFLIPSVRGVPVLAFLLLITLFTIVIGPLNYIFLWRRRSLYLLVLTIPVIAAGTSLSLLAYSSIAHGFSTKSRARTLTFVDQRANRAVTLARIALYAGLAPADGMRFSPETAVLPLWPEGHEFDSATTDWSERQNLRNGWLKSRTRTQFLTLGHRDERGRLDNITREGETLSVTNGFEWAFEALVVIDADGQTFYGANVPAGGTAVLHPMSTDHRREFVRLLNQFPMQPPEETSMGRGLFDWDFGYMSGYQPHIVSFSRSQLEQQLSAIRKYGTPAGYPAQSYAAVLSENPGIELGVSSTRPQASLHVLTGRY